MQYFYSNKLDVALEREAEGDLILGDMGQVCTKFRLLLASNMLKTLGYYFVH